VVSRERRRGEEMNVRRDPGTTTTEPADILPCWRRYSSRLGTQHCVTKTGPRDRTATFEPQIVKKRQRRLSGVDEVVLSLYAKGLTTGEISAHFAEIYGASVSKETISRITDKVIEEMNDWAVRPLDETYAAIFIDAIVVKVRDGQVGNRAVVRGHRSHPGRGTRHPRTVGRHRRGGIWNEHRFVLPDSGCCLKFSGELACR
jgi:Transposase, Mutator family